MFCDMVGSSALSTRLDAEEQREVIAAFHICCANEVKSLGGMVAQYLGDGVLAYFGYPTAHENDAERAILAGLAILKAVGTLKTAADVAVQTRIAIGSGVVVVGDLVREGVTQENAAIGETTNLVARLQAIAEPNSLVISPVTHRLVGALFDYLDLGRHTLKGFADPVHVRQVLGPSKVESRFEAQHQAGTSPLLGREEELELLLRRWEQAKRGEGRVVLVTGEPGIGKSRLARALRESLTSDPHTPLSYYCSPYHRDSALYPTIGQLVRAAGIERDDNAQMKLDKLENTLSLSSEDLSEDMPFFAAFLSIPGGDRYPLPNLTPHQLKQRTLGVLLDHLKRLAAIQTVLIVFEDLHWIDPTSLELLTLAIDQIQRQRIMLVATARPEFTPPWPSHRHVSSVSLTRLGRSEGQALIEGITKSKALPVEVVDQIMGRTDGIPLFIEELTKTVLESGVLREADDRYELTAQLPPLAIPPTLHASLLARLDRLASVKDVAQIGAVIGREFSYGLIAAVAAVPESNLRVALHQLVAAELMFQRGFLPDATYQFKHALVQDAAYVSLVRTRRQQLHGAIAHALEQQFPDSVETEPETLAHHFTEAGLTDRAIEYWRKAGERSFGRPAYVEAIKQLTKGLELTRSLPPSSTRDRRELGLLIILSQAVSNSKGWTASESLEIASRARDLLTGSGASREHVLAFWGLFRYHYGRAEHRTAHEVAQQFLTIAKRFDHPIPQALATAQIGLTQFYMGNLVEAQHRAEQSLQLLGTDRPTAEDIHIRVISAASLSRTQLLLGYPEQAVARAARAIVDARAVGTIPAIATALRERAYLGVLGGDTEPTTKYADEAVAYSAHHGLKSWEHWARCYQGIILTRQGQPQHGIEILRGAMAELERITSKRDDRFCLGSLAAAHAKLGQPDVGLTLLDDALQTLEQTSERYYEAELHRLRGELVIMMGKPSEAEVEFQTAFMVARRQQARWWELRAAATLARLWRDDGKVEGARDLLAPVYSWFTEGFDLPDLRDTNTLLDQLGQHPARS
jgi:predicted ATPase/class 3 adenylate cyclase